MPALIDALRRHAQQQPLAIALRTPGDAARSLSYAQLLAGVDALAAQLRALSVQRLGLYADNGIDWIVLDLAARVADICCVPLPLFFSPAQLAHVVTQSDLDAVLIDATVPRAGVASLFGADVIVTEDDVGGFALARRVPHGRVIDSAVRKITFTSGSTGNPKGVLLSAASMDAVTSALVQALDTVPLRNHLCVLPLPTLLENIAGVYVPLLRGSTCTVLPLAQVGLVGSSQFDAGALVDAIESNAADSMILTPQLLKTLLQTLRVNHTQLPSLSFVAVGGGKVAATLLHEAHELGLPVYEGYGLSECGSVVALNTPAQHRVGSCGMPLMHVDVDIDDGEVIVRGNAFSGYLDDDAAPNVAPAVRTGDLGFIDAQGFLHITGRRKNLLISSYGRNISPEWVESELASENIFLQCLVFGDDRPYLGALLYVAAGVDDGEIHDALDRVNQRLPDYARITLWQRLDAPFSVANGMLTDNLRPKRVAILAHYATAVDALYQRAEPGSTVLNLYPEVAAMTFYQHLNNATQIEREYLLQAPLIQRALNGSITRQEYIEFLTQAYHHVKHTVPLLMSVGGRIPADKEWLREAVAEYIEEELGHQEWILNDIEACGGDKEAVRNGRPAMATELMVSYAYDTVMRNNPVGFFGMVFVLEGTSINLACRAADSIQAALGLPNRAFTYLRSHGSLDIEHMHFFENLMNRIGDDNDKHDIVHAAQMFFQLYANIFRSIHAPQALAA